MPVALDIKHVTSLRLVLLSSVACSSLQHYFTLSKNGTIFEQKVFERIMCVLSYSTIFFRTFPIQRITGRDRSNMYISLHVKYPIFFSDSSEILIFMTDVG